MTCVTARGFWKRAESVLPSPLASLSSPAFPVASCVPPSFVLNGRMGRLSILRGVVRGEIPVVPLAPTETHTQSPNAEPLFWLMPLSFWFHSQSCVA